MLGGDVDRGFHLSHVNQQVDEGLGRQAFVAHPVGIAVQFLPEVVDRLVDIPSQSARR